MKAAWRAAIPWFALVSVLLVATATHAQQTSSTTVASTSSPFVGLLQMLLALAIVLGLIVFFAWLMRRLSRGQRFGGGQLKIRGGVMLGPRERVVLLEVADTWIVVGVGGGQVNALHAMPRPDNVEPASGDSVTGENFSAWLQRASRGGTKPPG